MSTPETDSLLKEHLHKIAEVISLCQKMERERNDARKKLTDLNDIYSHLPETVPTERRKAFLISIINQYKFNEHGHDEIPSSLPCPSPYLCTDRMRGPSGL